MIISVYERELPRYISTSSMLKEVFEKLNTPLFSSLIPLIGVIVTSRASYKKIKEEWGANVTLPKHKDLFSKKIDVHQHMYELYDKLHEQMAVSDAPMKSVEMDGEVIDTNSVSNLYEEYASYLNNILTYFHSNRIYFSSRFSKMIDKIELERRSILRYEAFEDNRMTLDQLDKDLHITHRYKKYYDKTFRYTDTTLKILKKDLQHIQDSIVK